MDEAQLRKRLHEQEQQLRFYHEFEAKIGWWLRGEEHKTKDEHGRLSGYWHCIPLSNRYFVEMLDFIEENYGFPTPRYFLDVGCGFGTKIDIASARCWNCHGIEIRKEYAEIAKELFVCRKNSIGITQCDAFEFTGYGQYDLIYMYQPIKFHEKMHELIEVIAKQMKVGAIMMGDFSFPTTDLLVPLTKERFCRNFFKRV